MAGITGSEFGISCNLPYGDKTGTGMDRYVDTTNTTANSTMAPALFKYFNRIRVVTDTNSDADIGNVYPNRFSPAMHLWVQYIKANYPSIPIHYGDAPQNSLPTNWTVYSNFVLADVAWAKDVLGPNDIFSVGNECLVGGKHSSAHITVTSLVRASNVVTATVASVGALQTGDKICITNATPSSFNVSDDDNAGSEAGAVATVTSPTTFTYPNTGVDETASVPGKWNWSAYEVTRKTKALAVACRAVAPSLKYAYSESQGHMGSWKTLGITPGVDLDYMAINAYGSGGGNEADYAGFRAEVDADFAVFGTNLIVTEFNVVQDSGNKPIRNFHNNHYFGERVFDDEMIRRYKYLKNKGITQIYLFEPNEYFIHAREGKWGAYGGSGYSTAYWTPKLKPIIHRMKHGNIDMINYGRNT